MPIDIEKEERRIDLLVRIGSTVAAAIAAAFVITFWVYDGSSFARTIALMSGIALGLALLSLVFGRGFWSLLFRVLFFWYPLK